jgi:hypothetical protein
MLADNAPARARERGRRTLGRIMAATPYNCYGCTVGLLRAETRSDREQGDSFIPALYPQFLDQIGKYGLALLGGCRSGKMMNGEVHGDKQLVVINVIVHAG